MKKHIYIFFFTVLGILLQFLIHAIIEIWYIGLLLKNFSQYSLGFSWSDWVLIHHIASTLLLTAGIFFGFRSGRFWWHKLYEK